MNEQGPPIRIGVSSCLLGEAVRYDGGHKLDRFITETLGRFFEWVAVCPEAEAGFGTPREPMHLEECGNTLKLITVTTGAELTPAMNQYARARIEALAGNNLSGYIFKSKSPSCGLRNVPVYETRSRGETTAAQVRRGRGLFADALRARFPNLPMEEEGRLSNPKIRENWIQRVFSYYRLSRLWSSPWTAQSLQQFHARHSLTLMSHSPRASLARLITVADSIPRQQLKLNYESEFMQILAARVTPVKNARILQHAAACLKEVIDSGSLEGLSRCIADYLRGIIPLSVPRNLIRNYLERYSIRSLSEQIYFNPGPEELALENHF